MLNWKFGKEKQYDTLTCGNYKIKFIFDGGNACLFINDKLSSTHSSLRNCMDFIGDGEHIQKEEILWGYKNGVFTYKDWNITYSGGDIHLLCKNGVSIKEIRGLLWVVMKVAEEEINKSAAKSPEWLEYNQLSHSHKISINYSPCFQKLRVGSNLNWYMWMFDGEWHWREKPKTRIEVDTWLEFKDLLPGEKNHITTNGMLPANKDPNDYLWMFDSHKIGWTGSLKPKIKVKPSSSSLGNIYDFKDLVPELQHEIHKVLYKEFSEQELCDRWWILVGRHWEWVSK